MAILDWKDATGRSIPAALDYFTLTGQIGLPVADTADGGEEPNLLEAAGRVILTPTITETRFMGTVNEDPVTLPLVKIELPLNGAGQVYVVDGVAGARILNPADPQLNPSGWGYRVSIEFDEVDDLVRPKLAPFVFTVPEPKPIGPDGARDHWVLDLTNLADVPPRRAGSSCLWSRRGRWLRGCGSRRGVSRLRPWRSRGRSNPRKQRWKTRSARQRPRRPQPVRPPLRPSRPPRQ